MLIILAVVSINAVLGENGIIKQAEKASKMYANSVVSEGDALDSLLQQLGTGNGNGSGNGSGQEENKDNSIIIKSKVATREGKKYIDLTFEIVGVSTTQEEAITKYANGNLSKFIEHTVLPEYSNEQLEAMLVEALGDDTSKVVNGKLSDEIKNTIVTEISSTLNDELGLEENEITLPYEKALRVYMYMYINGEEASAQALLQQAMYDMLYCSMCEILGEEAYYIADEIEQQIENVYKKCVDGTFDGTFEDILGVTKEQLQAQAENSDTTYELTLKYALLSAGEELCAIKVTVSNGDSFIVNVTNPFSYEITEEGVYTFTAELQDGSGRKGQTTVRVGDTLVEMYNTAKTAGCVGGESCTDAENHLHIGDYVNYQNPTSGTKTVLAADSGMATAGTSVGNQTYDISKNQLTWRVLGIDEKTGGLKLIAGSPMKTNRFDTVQDPYLYMRGATVCITEENGEIKAVNILNDICSMYANQYASTARSITVEDVNTITGVTEENITTVNIDNSEYVYGETYSFSNHWTPKAWLEDSKNPLAAVSGTITAYGYTINAPEGVGVTSASVTNTRAYNLLFNNIDRTLGEAQGACYWLASSGVGCVFGCAAFGPGVVGEEGNLVRVTNGNALFLSTGGEASAMGHAVRPVVVLKPEVTAEEIGKTDQTEVEDTWRYTMNPNAENN